MSDNDSTMSSAKELERYLNEFIDILQQEQLKLLDSDLDQITALVGSKDHLLARINSMDASLVKNLTSLDVDQVDGIQKAHIRNLISQCKRYNKENAALVAQNLKVTRNAISLLDREFTRSSIELYDVQGNSTTSTRGRDHGCA